MQQCAHMSAILLSGDHPLDICFYKKRRNYAIGVRSSSQMTPGKIDARSSAHVRKNNFRDPDPPPPLPVVRDSHSATPLRERHYYARLLSFLSYNCSPPNFCWFWSPQTIRTKCANTNRCRVGGNTTIARGVDASSLKSAHLVC